MSANEDGILPDDEFKELVDGTFERVYLLKNCVERDVTTMQEMNSIARELVFPELENDTKVWNAIVSWHNLWHDEIQNI